MDDGREPFLSIGYGHAFAGSIIFQLVAADHVDRKVMGLGMCKKITADRCRRDHHKGFGQNNAGLGCGVEELE